MKLNPVVALFALNLISLVPGLDGPGWSKSRSASAFDNMPEAADCEIRSSFMNPNVSEPRKMAEHVSVKILPQGSSSTGTIIGRRRISSDIYAYRVLTVSHGVTPLSGQIDVRTYDSRLHTVDFVDQNQSIPEFSLADEREIFLDLALLYFTSNLRYDCAPYYLGRHIGWGDMSTFFSYGFPADGDDSGRFEEGWVEERWSSTPNARPGGYTLAHTLKTETGFSGAGLFTSGGFLYGIHGQSDTISDRGLSKSTGVRYAVPAIFYVSSVQKKKSLSLISREDFSSGINLQIESDPSDFVAQARYFMSHGQHALAERRLSDAIYLHRFREVDYVKGEAYIDETRTRLRKYSGRPPSFYELYLLKLRSIVRQSLGNNKGASSDLLECNKGLADHKSFMARHTKQADRGELVNSNICSQQILNPEN
jgi:hypothetical protein